MSEETIKIIKGGIKNVVSRQDYERIYRPKGWELDREEVVKEMKTEAEIANFDKMMKFDSGEIDDGLFKKRL